MVNWSEARATALEKRIVKLEAEIERLHPWEAEARAMHALAFEKDAEIDRVNGILTLSETAAAHERDGLAAENVRLLTAIRRIDGINDNPAGYNPEINEVCNSILRPGAPSSPEDDGPRVLTRDNPTGRRSASFNGKDESLEKIVRVLSIVFQDKERAQQIFDRQVAGDISRETAIELLLDASRK